MERHDRGIRPQLESLETRDTPSAVVQPTVPELNRLGGLLTASLASEGNEHVGAALQRAWDTLVKHGEDGRVAEGTYILKIDFLTRESAGKVSMQDFHFTVTVTPEGSRLEAVGDGGEHVALPPGLLLPD